MIDLFYCLLLISAAFTAFGAASTNSTSRVSDDSIDSTTSNSIINVTVITVRNNTVATDSGKATSNVILHVNVTTTPTNVSQTDNATVFVGNVTVSGPNATNETATIDGNATLASNATPSVTFFGNVTRPVNVTTAHTNVSRTDNATVSVANVTVSSTNATNVTVSIVDNTTQASNVTSNATSTGNVTTVMNVTATPTSVSQTDNTTVSVANVTVSSPNGGNVTAVSRGLLARNVTSDATTTNLTTTRSGAGNVSTTPVNTTAVTNVTSTAFPGNVTTLPVNATQIANTSVSATNATIVRNATALNATSNNNATVTTNGTVGSGNMTAGPSLNATAPSPIPTSQPSVVPRGEVCDPTGSDKERSECGPNAFCQKMSEACKLGLCLCRNGYRKITVAVNRTECRRIKLAQQPCNPASSIDTLLLPDGAVCDGRSNTVQCRVFAKTGPCSKSGYNYGQACSSRNQCNSARGLVCNEQCLCPSSLVYDRTSGSCEQAAYGQPCNTNIQCLQSYGPQSNAAVCSTSIKRCRCNTSAGYMPAHFKLYGSVFGVTRCVLNGSEEIVGDGESCIIGDKGGSLCQFDHFCLHCPELETTPPTTGVCKSLKSDMGLGAASTSQTSSTTTIQDSISMIFSLYLAMFFKIFI